MDTFAISSLILLIANVIFVTKADFFSDNGFGESGTHLNKRERSVFGRSHDAYERDAHFSSGLGMSPTSFNEEHGFDAEAKIQYFPGAQIHRNKKYDKNTDQYLVRYENGDYDDTSHKPAVPTRKRRPTKYKKSRIFDIFRRTNDYNHNG